jgi:hypothetical protein
LSRPVRADRPLRQRLDRQTESDAAQILAGRSAMPNQGVRKPDGG